MNTRFSRRAPTGTKKERLTTGCSGRRCAPPLMLSVAARVGRPHEWHLVLPKSPARLRGTFSPGILGKKRAVAGMSENPGTGFPSERITAGCDYHPSA